MTTLAGLKAIAIGVGAVAALMYGYLFISQEALIFPGSRMDLVPNGNPAGQFPDVEDATLQAKDGTTLEGWFLDRGEGAPLLIYFGGNAEEVSYNIPDFRENFPGWSMVLFNYRGFAGSGGSPTETALLDDAVHIYDTFSEKHSPPKVVLMGRSIGCGVAVSLASRRKVDAMVLVSPYRSLVHLGRRYYPWVPVGLLLRHRFDSLKLVPGLQMPALVVAGGLDNIIPIDESRGLYEAMNEPVSYVEVSGAGHNDIHGFRAYWDSVAGFLSKQKN